MEAAAASVGKAALNGLLSGAKSAIAEESALTQAIQRDMVFLADELEEMHSTLRDVDEEQDYHKVPRNRVKQLRSLAYDVEDCLQEYSVHLEKPSWWRLARTVLERHRIAAEMKGLRARVEDMNQRNLHDQLMHSASSKLSTTTEQPGQSNILAARTFGIHEKGKSRVDIDQLIDEDVKELRVIAVWGTSGSLGQLHIIRTAYERPHIKRKFSCWAWVRMMKPFNPKDFVQSLVRQFHSTTGVEALLELDTEKTWHDLIHELNGYVSDKSYLVVINDLCTIEEWDEIKTCFPNNMKGSRIILCTSQVEVASLCAGQTSVVSQLRQLSPGPTVYVFHEKIYYSNASTSTNDERCLTRIKTMISTLEESQLIGRGKEKSDLIKRISIQDKKVYRVISVWGMGGIGKTTLVNHICKSQNLVRMFEKRAFVTMTHPFDLKELLKSLIVQLSLKSFEKENAIDFWSAATVGIEELSRELTRLVEGVGCLIVLDDLSSLAEWDIITHSFSHAMQNTSRIIITTRNKYIAQHCSRVQEDTYNLGCLEYNGALKLFTSQVFGEITNLDEKYPELTHEARLILMKCDGLPLAIVTIGGLLKFRPRTAMEWRKLHESISAESDINSNFSNMGTVLHKSFDGLPYHMKPCFLYLSIFPEKHKIRRRRLVQRWTAEGYSRAIHGRLPQSAEEVADKYFMELINRSLILPSQESIHSLKGIDSCQVHDIIRDISISMAEGEIFVFRLEEDYRSDNHGTARHLVISANWNGNKSKFENAENLSHIRSLTVFGKWRPFFISERMRLLRVLDLEGTTGLVDHHLKHIGKFLHLKFFSLRGCRGIYHLPDSVGNLVHIQTLDVKDTSIIKLPKAIIRLKKLEYLRAGRFGGLVAELYDDDEDGVQNLVSILTLSSVVFCVACWAPQLMKQFVETDGDLNRSDVCTVCCSNFLPAVTRALDPRAVVIPSGTNKLIALHTMGTVNIESGKGIIQDIGSLTQLKKLGVAGVNQKNSQELCSALANLINLESLVVQSRGMPGLHGCLDHLSSQPHNIQSLKLYGNLVKLPEFIMGLGSLVKLVLVRTKLMEVDATMQVLGKLPNLAVLRLLWLPFSVDRECRLTFHQEAFPSLMLLHLHGFDKLESVEFEEAGATPKLEQLLLLLNKEYSLGSISGLSSLPSLKEVAIMGGYSENLIASVRDQVSRNPNNPALMRE